MSYRGLKTHVEDVKQNIEFPRVVEEEKHGLTKDEIKKILDYASPRRKALYLTLLSSGMRIEETCALRKRDFDESLDRIQIHIPGKYTKTKKARTTFISREAAKYVTPILSKINPDKLVFGLNEDRTAAKLVELNYFTRLRRKAGFLEKYDSGVHKITVHSFRAWFITKCNRVDFGVGHALAGQELYMKRYDRLSVADKLEVYKKAEPILSIYENTSDEEREKRIADLEAKIENQKPGHEIAEELQKLFALSGHRLVIPDGDPTKMHFEKINPSDESKEKPKWLKKNLNFCN